MKRPSSPAIEPLESRIAPAVTIANPIFDIKAGVGKTSAEIDLATMVDSSASYRTIVEFVTNFTMPGASSPSVIRMELFDDKTPLTVQNFLSYVNNASATGDYDGTYFHRFVNGFVLQGGGFNPPISNNNLGTHVATPYQVHNEFFPDDAELDPLPGTVAMAKVGTTDGGGPHSATSEFFFNYADNSTTLDPQNGGFTVFGKVIQGLDAINAIVNLRKAVGSNLTTSGTDGIPTTAPSGSAPTTAQLVSIVSASVVTPGAAAKGNHTFGNLQVETVSGDQFLLAQLDPVSNKISLDYAPGKAGVAKVKVRVTDTKGTVATTDDEFVDEEFTVTVLPNLVSDVTTNIGSTILPGQKGSASVSVTNNGAGFAKGDVKVRLFLSEATSLSSDVASGYTLEKTGENADIPIGEFTTALALKSGATIAVPVKYEIGPTVANKLKHGSFYRVLAEIETPAGSTVQELFSDDNVGNFTGIHTFKNAFGVVDGKAGVSITIPDGTGTDASNVTLVLKGPGVGEASRDEVTGKLNIKLTGTTTASSFSIKTAKGVTDAEIATISSENAIGSIRIPTVKLTSHVALSGGVKSVLLGTLDSDGASSDFDIGGLSNVKTSIVVGNVSDYNFRSEIPVLSLSAKSWTSTADSQRETLEFSGLGKLAIKGNGATSTIKGDLSVDLSDVSATAISAILVKGDIIGSSISTKAAVKLLSASNVSDASFTVGNSVAQGSTQPKGSVAFKNVSDTEFSAFNPIAKLSALSWTNTAASPLEQLSFFGLGSLKVTGELSARVSELSGLTIAAISAGTIKDSVVSAAGEITSVTVGTLAGTDIFAGITSKPDSLAGFANARNIGAITVKTAFTDSNVVAAQFGKIAVPTVDGNAGTGKFGFYADVIKSYVRGGEKRLTNVTQPSANDTPVDTAGTNYEVRVF